MAMRNDVSLQKLLMTQPRPNSRERVVQWLTEKSELADGLFFVVTGMSANNAVGYVQVADIDRTHRRGSLGICLAPNVQGKGYGLEVLNLLETHVKDKHDFKKLILQVLADNYPAINLYLKARYREVGCLKEHFLLDGKFRDVLIMEKVLIS